MLTWIFTTYSIYGHNKLVEVKNFFVFNYNGEVILAAINYHLLWNDSKTDTDSFIMLNLDILRNHRVWIY